MSAFADQGRKGTKLSENFVCELQFAIFNLAFRDSSGVFSQTDVEHAEISQMLLRNKLLPLHRH